MGIPWSLPPFVCVCLCVSNLSCPTLCDPMDCSPPGPSVHGILQTRLLSNSSCPTLCDRMDCSPPGSSVHEILQARILEWVANPFSRGPSRHRDWTPVSCIGRRILYNYVTCELQLGWVTGSESQIPQFAPIKWGEKDAGFPNYITDKIWKFWKI